MTALRPCIECGTLHRNPSGRCAFHEVPAWRARPSPSSRNRPSPALRRKIKERNGYACACCGTPGTWDNPLHVHHRRQVALGGGHGEGNLLTLCDRCHTRAHAGAPPS